jgi:hypothetical protein
LYFENNQTINFRNSGNTADIAAVQVTADNFVFLRGRVSGSATYHDLIRCDLSDRTRVGNTTLDTLVSGEEVRLDGIINELGNPDTTDFPSGTWGMYRDINGNKTYLCANYGGTVYKIELT